MRGLQLELRCLGDAVQLVSAQEANEDRVLLRAHRVLCPKRAYLDQCPCPPAAEMLVNTLRNGLAMRSASGVLGSVGARGPGLVPGAHGVGPPETLGTQFATAGVRSY